MTAIKTITEWTIYFLIIFTPLAFGSVHIWAYSILELCIFGLIIICSLAYLWFYRDSSFIEINIPVKWIVLLFGSFIVLILIQMIPLPPALIKHISPSHYHLYKMTLPSYNEARSLSICIHQTRLEFFKLISYFGIFFLALNIFDSRKKIERVVIVILIAGVLEAFIGIFQMLTKTNKIFWFWQSAYKKGGYFGSFVNPNHFSAYMELAIFMAIGLLIARPKIKFFSQGQNWRHYLNRFEQYISKNILLIFLITIMGLSIFLSLSRGGILCFLFALIFIFMFQGIKIVKKRYLIVVTTCLTLAFLIWIGIDPVIKELSTLLKLRRASPERPIAWKDTIRIIKDYPLIGVGFGNFRNIFPLYKSSRIKSFWDHAHNEYLEIATDTGITGFLLFYTALFSCLILIIKKWLSRNEPFSTGITIGGIGAIFSIFMHNMVTFNFHISAISFLFFLIMAISIRSVHIYHHFPVQKFRLSKRCARIVLGSVCLFFIYIFVLQLNIYRADKLFKKYRSTKQIHFLKETIRLNPYNAGYHYALSQEYAKDLKNNADKALRHCITAIKLNPTNPWYHLQLAWIAYKTNNRLISPKKELYLALRLDPTNPYVKRYVKKWGI